MSSIYDSFALTCTVSISQVNVIYASTSGNVELVVQKAAGVLAAAGFMAILQRAEITKPEDLATYDCLLLATSTWDHGEVNPFFQPVLKYISQTDMSKQKAAFIGLGDHRYEQVFVNQGIKTVRYIFEKQGGIAIGETLEIDGDPYPHLQNKVVEWSNQLVELLKAESANETSN